MNIRHLAAILLLGAPLFAAAQAPSAIGEVALVTGSVTASVAGDALPKPLKTGDALAEGQTITVAANSYASLKFADGGRVLLRPNSEFLVESFKYTPAPAPATAAPAAAAPAGAVGSAFFRLVRGGFRAISGLIGKGDRQSYKVTTPVATIGIRGTDYEVQLCASDCPTQQQAGAAGTLVASNDLSGLQLAQQGEQLTPSGMGVILATHEGSIEARTSAGATFRVDAGQVGVMLASGRTFMLPVVPDALIRDPAPDPKTCE
jgi:hypothetical protein